MDLINQDALKDLVRSIVKEELDKTKSPEVTEAPKVEEPTADTVSNSQPDFDGPEIATPLPPATSNVLDTFAPTTPLAQTKPTSSVPPLNETPTQTTNQPTDIPNPATPNPNQPPAVSSPAEPVADTNPANPVTPEQNTQPDIASTTGVDNTASVLDMPIG